MRKPSLFLSIAILLFSVCLFFSCDDSFTDESQNLVVKLDDDISGSESARIKKSKFTLTPEEELGRNLFFDKISSPDNMSCADCHAPEVGFTGPIPGINVHGGVYPGAVPQRFGNRKPPTAAYATLSPVFYYDDGEGLP